MKQKIFLIVSGIFLAVSVIAAGAPLPSGWSPVLPVIDGDLNDPVWKNVPVITDFLSPEKKPVMRKTQAQILWTPTGIVFGFRAEVPLSEHPKIETPPHDKNPCCADCVEIMLDPAGDGETYRHFILNSIGGTYDGIREQGGFVCDEKWNGTMVHGRRIWKDCWTSEIFLPYSTLGIPAKDAKNWKVNLARESFSFTAYLRELSSTSRGSFHVGTDFRNVAVPDQVNLSPWKLDVSVPTVSGKIEDGKFRITVKSALNDLSGLADRDLLAEVAIRIPGSLSVIQTERLSLPGNGTRELNFNKLLLMKPGRYEAVLSVTDQQTERLLYRTAFPVHAEYFPIQIRLQDPHYRNLIFATQKLDKVRFDVVLDIPEKGLKGKITAGIRLPGGKVLAEKSSPAALRTCFDFPVAVLPEEKMEVFVRFGKDISTVPIRKLPYKKGEVWRGKDGNWYVDGKKIFLNTAWNSEDFYPEYTVIASAKVFPPYRIYNSNTYLGMGAIRDDLKKGVITDKVRAFYTRKVNMMKDEPALFGHFLCDEPDVMGFNAESFARVSDLLRELDPYHPIMISPGSSGLIDFSESAEISGFHAYPRVDRKILMNNFEKIVLLMDRAMKLFKERGKGPTVTYLHQGFDYSDEGNTDTRVPTYDEYRSQNLLSLILGGKGLMHYNRGVLNFPELYIGMRHLVREQSVIGNEAVIEPDAKEMVTDASPELRILAKRNEKSGAIWLLVCNVSRKTGNFRFRFAPFAGKKVKVLSENRELTPADGTVSDEFSPFEVRVYTTDLRDFHLKDLASIRKEIQDAYLKRREENKGHLAYQEHENDTVSVTASSNFNMVNRPENCLWHISDGMVGDGKARAVPLSQGIVFWKDKTPGKLPDWIAMQFRKQVTIGRVEIYPVEDSLKDYEIQVKKNGKFVTAASVKNASGKKQTVTFAPVTTDALRLFVTGNRGQFSMVYEIKVFEH